jgi:CheY-like chemotaxis protein
MDENSQQCCSKFGTAECRLLVVDDNDEFRESLRRALASHGFGVDAAAGGNEALSLWENAEPPYCALLVDIAMPDMSGFEVSDYIRKHPRTRGLGGGVPVILMSGYDAEPLTAPHARRVSADVVLSKLTSLEETIEKIKQLCFIRDTIKKVHDVLAHDALANLTIAEARTALISITRDTNAPVFRRTAAITLLNEINCTT